MTDQTLSWQRRAEELARRFDVVDDAVVIGGRRFQLLHPRSADDLIVEADFERDGRIPYWAEIWPSAVRLAEHLWAEQGAGRRCLELGCGAGLSSLAAAAAGYDVLATDYYQEALEFVELNAAQASIHLATRHVDWRDWPLDMGCFDRVIGADILYEKPYAELIADVIAQTLSSCGIATVTDPARKAAEQFPARCEERGLAVERLPQVRRKHHGVEHSVDTYGIRWAESNQGTTAKT